MARIGKEFGIGFRICESTRLFVSGLLRRKVQDRAKCQWELIGGDSGEE